MSTTPYAVRCPKCQNLMEKVTFKDVEVDRCLVCRGLWFDILEHEDLKKLAGAAKAVDTGDAKAGRKGNGMKPVKCPKCQAQMIQVHDPQQPHLTFDQCEVCDGLFMDAGEFRDFSKVTVSEFLKSLL